MLEDEGSAELALETLEDEGNIELALETLEDEALETGLDTDDTLDDIIRALDTDETAGWELTEEDRLLCIEEARLDAGCEEPPEEDTLETESAELTGAWDEIGTAELPGSEAGTLEDAAAKALDTEDSEASAALESEALSLVAAEETELTADDDVAEDRDETALELCTSDAAEELCSEACDELPEDNTDEADDATLLETLLTAALLDESRLLDATPSKVMPSSVTSVQAK